MRTVSHNTAFLTGASIVQKALSFVYFTILARSFSGSELGTYSYALAFTTLFAVVVDGGLSPVLIRYVAAAPEQARDMLRRILQLKSVLLVVALVLMASAVAVLDAARSVAPLIAIAAIVMVVDSLHLTVYGVIRGRQNLFFESTGMVVSQLISLCGVVAVSFFHVPILYAILSLGAGSVCNALWAIRSMHRTAHDVPPTGAQLHDLSTASLAREAAPFALAGIFARGYSYLDVLLIGSLMSFAAAGTYSIANKLTFVFQFIPLALSASLYPAFSKLGLSRASEGVSLWESSERYLLIVAGFIVSLIIALRQELLFFFGPDHVSAGSALSLLAVSLVFAFVSYPIGALLNGMGLQRLQTIAMGGALVANATLNIILIPYFGVVGAAASALIGNALLSFVGGVYLQRRVAQFPWARMGAFALRCALSGFVAYGVVLVVVSGVSQLLTGSGALTQLTRMAAGASAGLAAYVCAGFLFGCITLPQLQQASGWVRRKLFRSL